MKVSLNSDRNNTFDPENNVINYDPTSGLDIKAGISSPASGFAHELSHAVQFHKVGYIAFVESLEEPILSVDHIVDDSGLRSTKFTYGISAEEARATIFESTVQSQLGEPVRLDYSDGRSLQVNGPKFSCFEGTEGCF